GGGGGGGGGADGGTGGGDMAHGAPGDMAMSNSCTPGPTAAGTASSYTVGGTPKLFGSGSKEFFVVRDAGGLFAVSAICTHSGCTNEVNGGQFYCPCHGATFAFDGSNPTSPAHSALKHYAMCVDASGNVTVNTGTTVPSTTRS
ncbi:MAG: qcrB 2, partial [bacterium]|nr:qcrB 2 [bacterium]